MYISRIAEKQLEKMLKSPKIAIIIGARQVGKTTLVEHLLSGEKTAFLNLDIEVDKQRLLAISALDPKAMMKALAEPKFLVIDEAQRLPEVGRIVKGVYDAKVPIKVILSGSSSLDLLNQTAESLTGRNEKLFLPPLVFQEIIAAQSWYSDAFGSNELQDKFQRQLHAVLLENIIFGSYPEVVSSAEKEKIILSLASDYLFKDILQLGLIKTPNLIKNLLMLLSHQVGSEVSVNELSISLGIARPTVERYLDLLEQTYVIFRLPAYSTNPRKEITKSNKIYFWDTGIRNALINEFSVNEQRSDIGALWENWAVAELAKQNLLSGQRKNLYFWRSRAGGEVDLVMREDGKLEAFEIKWKRKRTASKLFEMSYGVTPGIIDSARPILEL